MSSVEALSADLGLSTKPPHGGGFVTHAKRLSGALRYETASHGDDLVDERETRSLEGRRGWAG